MDESEGKIYYLTKADVLNQCSSNYFNSSIFLASQSVCLFKELKLPQGLHFTACHVFEMQN